MTASATKPGLGLAAKIFIASTLVVVVVLLASLGLTFLQTRRTADQAIGAVLRRNRTGLAAHLRARADGLAGMSVVSAGVPQFRERLLRDPELANRVDQATEYRDLIGAAWVLVTDAEGLLLARTDYPLESGADLSRGALIADALAGDQTRGAFIDDRDPDSTRLYFAVATPLIETEAGAPQGVLVASFALDDGLAADLAVQMDADLAFFALDRAGRSTVLASTLPTEPVARALTEKLNLARLDSIDVASLQTDTSVDTLAAEIGGEHYIGLPLPLRSAAGDLFGGVVAFRPRGAELAAFHALRNMIWIALGVGVALALVSAGLLGRQIASPVRRLVEATHRVQDGDYAVEIPAGGRDEIGALARAFQALVSDLREKQALVEYITAASGGAATQPLAAARTEVRQAAVGRRTGPIEPGALFAGRYEIKEILGMGGMGVVYRAFDRELAEPLAIKTLRTEVVGSDGVALERFKQEIRLARKITHRNVVRTYDLGETGGTYYITMEFVEGTPLKQLIESRGRLPVPVTLTIGKQLCRALEVAHEQGVIHRDVKPQNIVVEPNGFIKVMDFGIARLVNPPKGKGLTEVGTAIGTPDYMSPEQLLGEEIDARSDLYSTGAVLFECLTGRQPFVAESVYALVAKHLEEEPADPREINPDVSEPLGQVVLKAMAKQRDARYASAGELHDALAAIG